MNIRPRTCANCAAFNPTPTVDEPSCWNLTSFTVHPGTAPELHRSPEASDFCDDHLTPTEDAEDTALIEEHREQGGIEQAIQATSSMSIARSVVRRAMQ